MATPSHSLAYVVYGSPLKIIVAKIIQTKYLRVLPAAWHTDTDKDWITLALQVLAIIFRMMTHVPPSDPGHHINWHIKELTLKINFIELNFMKEQRTYILNLQFDPTIIINIMHLQFVYKVYSCIKNSNLIIKLHKFNFNF